MSGAKRMYRDLYGKEAPFFITEQRINEAITQEWSYDYAEILRAEYINTSGGEEVITDEVELKRYTKTLKDARSHLKLNYRANIILNKLAGCEIVSSIDEYASQGNIKEISRIIGIDINEIPVTAIRLTEELGKFAEDNNIETLVGIIERDKINFAEFREHFQISHPFLLLEKLGVKLSYENGGVLKQELEVIADSMIDSIKQYDSRAGNVIDLLYRQGLSREKVANTHNVTLAELDKIEENGLNCIQYPEITSLTYRLVRRGNVMFTKECIEIKHDPNPEKLLTYIVAARFTLRPAIKEYELQSSVMLSTFHKDNLANKVDYEQLAYNLCSMYQSSFKECSDMLLKYAAEEYTNLDENERSIIQSYLMMSCSLKKLEEEFNIPRVKIYDTLGSFIMGVKNRVKAGMPNIKKPVPPYRFIYDVEESAL